MFQSLESLRAQEEARSKRHSTSELGTITFSDVRKEGWLHYKQILTEKGKVQHTSCTQYKLIDPSLIPTSLLRASVTVTTPVILLWHICILQSQLWQIYHLKIIVIFLNNGSLLSDRSRQMQVSHF